MKHVMISRIGISVVVVSLFLVCSLAFSEPANAQRLALSEQTMTKLEASNKLQQKQEDKAELPCQIVRIRLQSQAERAGLIRIDRVQRYETVSSRLENLVERLKVSKKQVGAIPENVTNLRSRINSFQTASTTYESSLKSAASSACTTEIDELEVLIEIARTEQKNLVTAASNVDSAITNQVIKNLKEFTLSNAADTVDTSNNKTGKN